MNKENVLAVIGILVCLIGAIVMVEGHGLGERTTAVAIVLGICGISLIATSGGLLQEKKPLTQKKQWIMYGMVILMVIAVVFTALLV